MGENHYNYSKRAMALDQVEVMEHFGFTRFRAVGHDRGGRVLRRMALDHPDRVERMAVLDIVPAHYLYNEGLSKAFVDAYFHWFLYIRPAPFPENIIAQQMADRPRVGPNELVVAEFARTFSDPATIHAMCEDYRASASIDLEFDEADMHRKIECPLWKMRGTDVTGRGMPGGHNFHETHPVETLDALLPFLA